MLKINVRVYIFLSSSKWEKRHCIRQMSYYREVDTIVERELKIRLQKKYLIL